MLLDRFKTARRQNGLQSPVLMEYRSFSEIKNRTLKANQAVCVCVWVIIVDFSWYLSSEKPKAFSHGPLIFRAGSALSAVLIRRCDASTGIHPELLWGPFCQYILSLQALFQPFRMTWGDRWGRVWVCMCGCVLCCLWISVNRFTFFALIFTPQFWVQAGKGHHLMFKSCVQTCSY